MVANAGIVVIVRGSQTGLTDLRMQIWSQQSPNVPDDPEDTDLFGYSLAAGALKTQQPVCSETGVVLFMPDTDYVTGQTCSCHVLICNAEASPLENYPLFVILEVAGSYYFAPSFGEYDSYLDDYPVFSRGLTRIDVLDEFEWPPDVGSYSGCVFYAALTDPGITDIFGVMDDWTFGWH